MEEFNSADILRNQNRKKRLAFLEVGLFEISFVLIFIVVIFGTLNYFNILSLSTLYPNQLGFLPRKQLTNTKINQKAAVSMPTPFASYNWNYAQTTLEKFLRDNINPEFLPNKIQGEQGLIATDSGRGTEYEFGAKWETDNEFIVGFFHYGPKTNIPSDMQFFVQVKNKDLPTATQTLTKELSQKYLKDVPANVDFECGITSDKKTSYCETMSNISSGKKGFGIAVSAQKIESPKTFPIVIVFSCFIPKNGIYYNKWNSCIANK